MDPRNKTAVVAFFGGTGYDFDIDALGYVSQETILSHKIKEEKREEKRVDSSMAMLSNALSREQERYGYDGCHRRGGGVLGYGTEEPADHLVKELKKKLSRKKNEKMTLILTAHSRGCFSALFTAKKLSEDRQLSKQVEVILDLRDPVPGSFKWTTRLDSSNLTDVRLLYDLRACANIKEAHITVQEKGILSIAFSVLVPRFSPETELEVDYLPGIHDIQEKDLSLIYRHKEEDYFLRHYAVHLLGICQSMKLYARHDAIIDANLFFEELTRGLHLIQVIDELKPVANPCEERARMLYKRVNILLQPLWSQPFKKEPFIAFLSTLEKLLYDNLLEDLRLIHGPQGVRHGKNKRKAKPILSRELHHGGEFQQLVSLQEATHLNQQHALLAYEQREPEAKLEFKPLLGFKGKRLDLSKMENASKAIAALRLACQNYLKKEVKRPAQPQSAGGVVEALYKMVEQDPVSPSFKAKKEMLSRFEAYYTENKNFLEKNTDDRKFCTVVGYILASLFTCGIYLGVRTYRSYRDRGSLKFWQTRREIFTGIVADFIAKPAFKGGD